ncbi:hypothetical protein [Oryzomicrobium sp.]|uniref:hypothetical protein n=1 Tax=Oryzomicrobium sp. TaxID=1911578 RepID=UPI002FE003DC
MGRKALTPTADPVGPDFAGATPPDMAAQEAAVNRAQELAGGMAEERDLLNQLLGQAQMADAFSQFSKTVFTSKLAFVKENKLYRALSGRKSENGIQFSGTWDEFCGLMKITPQHANDNIANLKALGEEALESMSRMGIGYRELRQFRRLPDDQKTALIEVAKAGDKDSFLELAEDLIAKHAREKEALTQRAEEAEANLEARAQVLADKTAKIDQLTEKVAKATTRVKAQPPAEVGEEIRKEVTLLAAQAEVGIRALYAGLQALADHTEAHGIDHGEFTAGLICQLELTLRQLRSEFDVKRAPDGDATPEWLRPGASEAAAARVAEDMAAAGWKRDADGRMVPAAETADA